MMDNVDCSLVEKVDGDTNAADVCLAPRTIILDVHVVLCDADARCIIITAWSSIEENCTMWCVPMPNCIQSLCNNHIELALLGNAVMARMKKWTEEGRDTILYRGPATSEDISHPSTLKAVAICAVESI